jgi:serine phosphatase RsbU (regulator of sigma subunit)
LAVFFAIAVVLLAGGTNGPLASAEATGGNATEAPLTEPMLGADPPVPGDVAQTTKPELPVGEQPVDEPPADEPPADDGVPTGPPDEGGEEPGEPGEPGEGEEPPAEGEEPPAEGEEDPGDGGEDPGADPGTGEDDPTSGGDTGGGDRRPDPDDTPPEEEDLTPPSGGGKGEEPPSDDPNGEQPEPAPDPTGRPQLTLPADLGGEPGPAPPPGTGPTDTPVEAGEGWGTMRDSSGGDDGSGDGDNRASFGVASGTGGGATAGGGDGGEIPVGTELAAVQDGGEAPAGDGGTGPDGTDENGSGGGSNDEGSNVVTNTVERLVKVVPDELKAALAALAALSVMLGIGYLLAALRARRLARQRRELLQEVGLLQTALLPPVPDKVGALLTSVAYRPADGPGAGGDFYDVLPLPGGRVGFILGDVSGHGRGALARTAFMRYTLRAYLEAGLEPRVALQVAGRVIDDNLGGDFATVLLAVHDPDTGSLTYACAGHPSPIVVGPQPHEPVTAASSPPIGVGVRTGLRQTTVPLVPGSVACLFTDGLIEARTPDGILGRERLTELLAEIGDEATARQLIERVATEANALSDDMAAVVVSPTAGVTTGLFRTEQLELSTRELEGPIARRFLEACGLSDQEVDDAERDARALSDAFGGVVLHVVFGNRLRVEVLPRNVESIEAASRRVSAGNPQ